MELGGGFSQTMKKELNVMCIMSLTPQEITQWQPKNSEMYGGPRGVETLAVPRDGQNINCHTLAI